MLTILVTFLTIWLLWGFIKLAWAASWGILKLVGMILSVIAFPIIFIGLIAVGIGAYMILPIALILAAFGCLARA